MNVEIIWKVPQNAHPSPVPSALAGTMSGTMNSTKAPTLSSLKDLILFIVGSTYIDKHGTLQNVITRMLELCVSFLFKKTIEITVTLSPYTRS